MINETVKFLSYKWNFWVVINKHYYGALIFFIWSSLGIFTTYINLFDEDTYWLLYLTFKIWLIRFQVKKKQFFKNFTTILLFGICGTVISFYLISVGNIKSFSWTSSTANHTLLICKLMNNFSNNHILSSLKNFQVPFRYLRKWAWQAYAFKISSVTISSVWLFILYTS